MGNIVHLPNKKEEAMADLYHGIWESITLTPEDIGCAEIVGLLEIVKAEVLQGWVTVDEG